MHTDAHGWPMYCICVYPCVSVAIMPSPRVLDVGCGVHKQPGAIGLDRNPASRADVLADLDRFPYPFADSSFDHVTAIHVIEHVDDVIRTMEEFHRLVR